MEINKPKPLEKTTLWDKLCLFNDYFNPHIIAELNGQRVNLIKFKGTFIWQIHENEDKLFIVILGKFTMQFRNRNILVSRGELLVVPRGTEYCPFAEDEAWLMVIEPAATSNQVVANKD